MLLRRRRPRAIERRGDAGAGLAQIAAEAIEKKKWWLKSENQWQPQPRGLHPHAPPENEVASAAPEDFPAALKTES